MPPARASMPRWLAPFSTSGSISPRPIPTSQPCGSGCLASKTPCACAFAHFCWGRFSRRRTGSRRRSIFTRPKAATCGATSNASAPSSRCRSAVPIRFPRTACSPLALRWSGSTQAWGKDFCLAVFRSEFGKGRSIESRAAIGDVLAELSIDAAPALEAARSDAIKTRLRAQTDEAQRLGLFGAPSFTTTDGELFWGNDRLEQALRWQKRIANGE